MTKDHKYGIFVFRRDHRLYDNSALIIAHNQCERVIPIFIFTPEQVSERNSFRSTKSIQFMIESLMNLSNDIETNRENYIVSMENLKR